METRLQPAGKVWPSTGESDKDEEDKSAFDARVAFTSTCSGDVVDGESAKNGASSSVPISFKGG
jgi:hypothetical protein